MSKTPKPQLSEAEMKLRNKMAKALWDIEMKEKSFESPTARNEAFSEDRNSYLRKTAEMIMILKNRGVVLDAEMS